MLLLWCLSMIHVFSYPLGERTFHLFVDLKQAIVSVSGGLSPHNFEMCSISPQQACSFRCWFPNNSVITFLEGCFPSSFVAEVVIFFSILYSKDLSSIIYFFRRHCDVALFTHLLGLWGPCSFRAYPFPTGVSCPLFKFFPFCQVLPPFSTGVLSEIFLTHCAILSIVPEAVCCWFH